MTRTPEPSTNRHITNDQTTTTRTTTEHKPRDNNQTTKTDKRARRSKESHRGIVINRGGPASGRPPTAQARLDRAPISSMIDLVGSGWASC